MRKLQYSMQEETLAPHQQTARLYWSVLMTDYEATHATHAWAARYGLVLPGSSKCEFWFMTIKELLSQALTLLPCFRAVANDISLFAPFQALPDPKDFGLRKGCGLLEQLVNRIPLANTQKGLKTTSSPTDHCIQCLGTNFERAHCP